MKQSIVWYSFSFKRHFGDRMNYKVPIVKVEDRRCTYYIWKHGRSFTRNSNLEDLKKTIFGSIREQIGD